MATAVSPLLPAMRRGWAPVVHSYFKVIPRRLPSGAKTEFVILGNVIDDTAGAPGRPEWVRATHAYFAHLANVTEDAAGKALHRLLKLELIARRRCGRGWEYKALVENFDHPPEHAPRSIRKPPTVAMDAHGTTSPDPARAAASEDNNPLSEPDYTNKIVEMSVENSECKAPLLKGVSQISYNQPPATCPHCGEDLANAGFAHPSLTDTENEGVSKTIPCVDARYPLASGSAGATPTPAESKKRQLERFCVETITPKLGTVPEKNALARALKTLGRAPVEMLNARIVQRLELFSGPKASWGALPLLAEDVAKAHFHLTKLRGATPAVDLASDWASAARVRSLHRAPDTPEHLRRELTLMWPELAAGTAPRAKSNVLDTFTEFLRGRHGKPN